MVYYWEYICAMWVIYLLIGFLAGRYLKHFKLFFFITLPIIVLLTTDIWIFVADIAFFGGSVLVGFSTKFHKLKIFEKRRVIRVYSKNNIIFRIVYIIWKVWLIVPGFYILALIILPWFERTSPTDLVLLSAYPAFLGTITYFIFHLLYHFAYARSQYDGEWKDDKMHGQGTMTYVGGNQYIGEWVDSKQCGQGTMTYAGGNQYIGEWVDSKQCGQGTMTYVGGDQYVGEWEGGKRNGQGTINQIDGGSYTGEWKDNKMCGQGTKTFINGDIYIGEWEGNTLNGQGSVKFANGDKYVGTIKENKRDGLGIITYSDKSAYEGEWKDDVPHGKGAVTSSTGKVISKGLYYKGDFVPKLCQEAGLEEGTDAHQHCILRYMGKIDNE